MKIVVIGLGSMGKRRIRLLQKYDKELQITGVDLNDVRRKDCENSFNIGTYVNLTDVEEVRDYDCAFVCTAPLTHHKIITQCLEMGLHVFTELNLVADGYDENITLAKKHKRVLFLSSTFLFREEIIRIKKLTSQNNKPMNYVYHIGQYLPDWHPWENYQDYFVSEKRTNACREIMAIELPWIIDTFGEILNTKVVKGKISNLEIHYPDSYMILFQHQKRGQGTLIIDVVSRKAVRNLEVFGETLYLQWDGTPNGLIVYDFEKQINVNQDLYEEFDHQENYSSFVVENAYLNEIIAFFEAVSNNKEPAYNFKKDKTILSLIDEIES